VIGWVFLSWLVQGKVPDWAAQARTRPMLEKSGDALVAQLPENPEGFLKQFKKPKVATPPNEAADAPAETDAAPQRRTETAPTPTRR
jgi:membrane protein required for colicin V production